MFWQRSFTNKCGHLVSLPRGAKTSGGDVAAETDADRGGHQASATCY